MAKKALESGIRLIQLRADKHPGLLVTARKIGDLAQKYDAIFILNNHSELANKTGYGLHIGQSDTPLEKAKKLLRTGSIIGISAHNPLEAKKAEDGGAHYIGVGPVFRTQTKNISSPLTLLQIEKIIQAVSIPSFLIGGINTSNIKKISHLKHHGIAVASALISCENIKDSIKTLNA